MTDVDVLIAGGGIAGLVAGAAFAAEGRSVLLVDAGPGPERAATEDSDLRSTAILEPSIAFLTEIGLWPVFADGATDLATMRLLDAGGRENAVRTSAAFAAVDTGRPRFGVNVLNAPLRARLSAEVAQLPGVRVRFGCAVTGALARSNVNTVALDDGTRVHARLAIAADGRNSRLRKAAGIGVRRWGFGQKALVFAVSHPLPHNNVSTEIHRTGGPFTLVPLPDRAGVPHSAVVWMERGPVAGRLHALDDAAFEEELNARSCGVLGPLRLAGKRAVWPIVNLLAHRFDGPRLALVAEAAHVMPPIGAQGLNTSLGDLRALTALTRGAADPGAAGILSRYHRTRYAPVAARMAGVDLLNRAALAGPQPLRDLRNAGLRLLDATPLRRVAMQVGLGAPLGPVSGKP